MMRQLLAAIVVLVVLAAVALVLFARGTIGGDALRRTLEAQLTTRLGRPVTIGSLGASFFPRVAIELHGVSIGQPAEATIGQVSIVTGLRGLLSKRVEDAQLIVSDARMPAAMVAGLAGGASSGGAPAGDGVTIVSVRTLALRDVEVIVGSRSVKLDLESSMDGDRLDVSSLELRSNGTDLKATGALTSIKALQGSFTATAEPLNVDELLGIGAGLSSPGGESARDGPSVDMTVKLTAPRGELSGYAFTDLSSTLHVVRQQIALDPLRLGIFGGRFDGRLRVTPAAAAQELAIDGLVTGINVSTLLQQTRGSSSMSGTMSGSLSLASRGTTSSEMVKGAHGNGTMTIADGKIPGLDLVRAVVLAFGKPNGAPAQGSGSAFSRIAGSFALAGEVLRAENITFASRDFDMGGALVVRLPAGALDMHANVVLSRELTAQAGTDLRRYAQQDGRIVLPATIGGTLASPRVSIDVAAVLNRAIQNEIQRRLKGLFR
jgi:hypothetical protein